MVQSSLSHLAFLKPYLSHILITFTCWLGYFYSLRTNFVSDDWMGIVAYDGSLMYPKLDSEGKEIKDKAGNTVKYLRLEYGTLWRWLRYHIVGGNTLKKVKQPDGKKVPTPLGKIPSRHHFLSILVFNITCLVTFQALSPIIGQKFALLSILILIVHPCTTQGVAWISGLAYPLSLFWISLIILLTRWFYLHPTLNSAVWVIPLFCFLQFMAIHAIFATTAMIWTVLLFLGYWQLAVLSLLISIVMCFDIIRQTITLRVEEFKKQKMAQSTKFHWRKFIVAMKTLWYYICFAVFPVRIGLYHEWGFHYDSDMEIADSMFWLGFLSLCSLIFIFFKIDCISIKLGILWFLVFSTGFWNWITAMQFVTERYILVANLGLGMIIAVLTQNCLWAYSAIFTAYLIRTWYHLPTYDNELRFYQSNCWNFQKSEVALGNLGVTQVKLGLEGTGKETWLIASQMNPNYDVPWINVFYQLRTQGHVLFEHGDFMGGLAKFKEAVPYVEKALAAKICHFPEQWKQEHASLIASIRNPAMLLSNELKRLIRLKEDLLNMSMKAVTPERIKEIEPSIANNDAQIIRLTNFMKANNISVVDPMIFNKMNTDNVLNKLTRRQ